MEFKNKLIYEFLEKENIKIIHSNTHHPQTNGCIERYHREVHKYIKNYLNNFKDFSDKELEDALNEYIIYHNNKIKKSTKYSPNEIRDINYPILIQNTFKVVLEPQLQYITKHFFRNTSIL